MTKKREKLAGRTFMETTQAGGRGLTFTRLIFCHALIYMVYFTILRLYSLTYDHNAFASSGIVGFTRW